MPVPADHASGDGLESELPVSLRVLLVCFVLSAVLILPSRPAAAASVADAGPPWSSQIIVGVQADTGFDDASLPVPRLATSRLFPAGTTLAQPLGGGAYRLDLAADADSAALATELMLDPRVRYVEPDYLLTLINTEDITPYAVTPNDPAWSRQEEMRVIEANRAWEVTTGSPQVVIAVLDTGVLSTHVDLVGKLLPGFDFLAGKPGAVDDQGHGTFTAALAAGTGNNKAGMAGVCWGCRILPLKILNEEGRGPTSAFSQAIRYAVDNGARVVNVSAGGPNRSQAMEDAIAYATSKNVLVVAAAGNTPEDRPNYPAAIDPVVAVAASGPGDTITEFSSFGPFVDLAAPGVNIVSAYIGGNERLARANGTSASAPLVSGAAGLLVSVRPDLSADALSDLLVDTAVDIGAAGRDDNFGQGRLATYDSALAATRPGALGDVKVQVQPAGASRFRITAGGFDGGEGVRVWTVAPDGRTRVYRGLAVNGRGQLDTVIELDPEVQAGIHQLTLFGDRSHRVANAALAAELPNASGFFRPVAPVSSSAERLYFPETQHTLSSGFRTYWEANGGLAIFGFPISEEFREVNASDGRTYTVQYFERNRFEYHPEHKGTPYEVQLGLLGALVTAGRTFPPGDPVADSPTRRYFDATRHTLSGDFLQYWAARGGLAIFGYPISEPLEENGRLVQYFERNRFELHPELPPAYRVSLGLLGSEMARRSNYLSASLAE